MVSLRALAAAAALSVAVAPPAQPGDCAFTGAPRGGGVGDVLDGLCARGECRRIRFLWRPTLSDPKDDHILELAVAAGSADIVTHNVRHFAGASAFAIRIVTPAGLLGELT